MIALSITLPGSLASESKRLAERLGLSRSEFIRIAVKHEVARMEKELKLKAMAQSFKALRKDKKYLAEINDLDQGFSEDTIEDADDWWL